MRMPPLMLLMLVAACGSQAESPAATPSAEASAAVAPIVHAAAPQAAARPDLATCPKLKRDDENGLLERKRPLPVPRALAGIAVTDMNQLAVTTLDGKTGCVDVRWMETVDAMALSKDQRFLSFDWNGYEAYGHVVVDRQAGGQSLDTGEPPVWSQSGARLAAADLSESAFGALNGFGVWDVTPKGFKQLALLTDALPSGDWRTEGWRGETCVALSLLPSERMPEDARAMDKAPRDPWFAAERNQWKPQPGSCPKA